MLFWSAVVNGVLAPPLVVLVVLLSSDPKVMGRAHQLADRECTRLDLRRRNDDSRSGDVRYLTVSLKYVRIEFSSESL